MHYRAIVFGLLVIPVALRAQRAVPASRTHTPQPTSVAITPADAMTRLYIIADDSMMGRDAGTIGNYKATAYIAAELQRLGLEPVGDNGTYFQRVPLLNVRLAPKSRVIAGETPLEFIRDVVPTVPDARWRVRPFDGATVVYGGNLNDTTTYISPSLAAGKAIVFDVDTNAMGLFQTLPLYALRRPGGRFASAAAMIAVGKRQEETGMMTAAVADRYVNTFLSRVLPDAVAVAPTMFMSRRAAQLLFDAPLESLRPGTVGRRLHGSLSYAVADTAEARNVVAVLRGRDAARRGEYVAIGAHSDHIGRRNVALDHDSVFVANRMFRPLGARQVAPILDAAQSAQLRAALDSVRRLRPVRRDSIYNGSDDDGSGSTALLEIAEAFAGARDRPERSILFVWHTAEEGGILGSGWFTSHPTVPRDSIVAQLQMDHVSRGRGEDTPGGGPRYVAVVNARPGRTPLGDVIDSANAHAPWHFDIDWTRGRPDAVGGSVACGSDHAAYDRYGIPVAFFFTGFHADYHQVTDEPQYADFDKLAHVAQLVHDVALRIADSPQPPPRLAPLAGPGTACRP